MTDTKPTRNPLSYAMDRILRDIVYPDVRAAARNTPDPTATSIHRTFCEQTGSSVSLQTFREWLRDSGVILRKTVQFETEPTLGEEDHNDAT